MCTYRDLYVSLLLKWEIGGKLLFQSLSDDLVNSNGIYDLTVSGHVRTILCYISLEGVPEFRLGSDDLYRSDWS